MGCNDKIVAIYARGMPVREIQKFLPGMFAVEVLPDLISRVADAVVEDVTAWQSRLLELMYPLVLFDALRVTICEDAMLRNKAVCLVPGGRRDLLGLWIENTKGA